VRGPACAETSGLVRPIDSRDSGRNAEISKLPQNAARLIFAGTTYRIGIGLGRDGGQEGGMFGRFSRRARRVVVADLNRARQQVLRLLHGHQGEDVTGADLPLPGDALTRAGSVDRRLAAIERWVGLGPDLDALDQEIARVRRDKEAAIDRQDFDASAALRDQEKQLMAARASQEKDPAEAAAGRVPLAQELARVKAEVDRLRAAMREHGIAPDDDAE
jgi:hypothetical protein